LPNATFVEYDRSGHFVYLDGRILQWLSIRGIWRSARQVSR